MDPCAALCDILTVLDKDGTLDTLENNDLWDLCADLREWLEKGGVMPGPKQGADTRLVLNRKQLVRIVRAIEVVTSEQYLS